MEATHRVRALPLLLALAILSGCAQKKSMPVSIDFELAVGDQPVTCADVFSDVGTGQTTLQIADARMYIQDLRLIDANGHSETVTFDDDGKYQSPTVAMLDFEDGTDLCEADGTPGTHTTLTGSVAEGTYVGLSFTVGVPEDLNHGDPTTAAPPLGNLTLQWSWNEGYRFMRFDLIPANGTPFDVHIGSTECNKDSSGAVTCNQENRTKVRLSKFDADNDRVNIDLGTLVSGSDLEADMPGCIAGGTPDICAPIFKRLGIDSATGDANATAQKVFRAESK